MTAIRNKQKSSNEFLEHLLEFERGNNPVITRKDVGAFCALAIRMQFCAESSNIFFGDGMLLNRETGEVCDGCGNLWSCKSRFCPFCASALAKKHRQDVLYTVENTRLHPGESWYFITFTLPDAALKNLTLEQVAAIKQDAWRRFAHYETNPNKSQTWFQKHFRGGFKSYEFEVEENNFHYHAHSLVIGNNKIRRNGFLELRRAWTKALQASFKKHNVKFNCGTKDGLVVVNVEKIGYRIGGHRRREAAESVTRYFTKNESWLSVPPEQIADIAFKTRGWRMFESFGVCREILKEREKNKKPKSCIYVFYLALQTLANANVHIKQPIPSRFPKTVSPKLINLAQKTRPPPEKRKRAWFRRILDGEIDVTNYYDELTETVGQVQHIRKAMLRRKYYWVSKWKTADGATF